LWRGFSICRIATNRLTNLAFVLMVNRAGHLHDPTMTSSGVPPEPLPAIATSAFATTHWSVVLAAGDSSAPGAKEALEKLCRIYWFPLYAFARRQGHSPHDAQDLTQEFFAWLLESRQPRVADSERGKVRSFLLGMLKNFLSDERKKAQARHRADRGPLEQAGFMDLAVWHGVLTRWENSCGFRGPPPCAAYKTRLPGGSSTPSR
jgi:hypothetical protein